MTGWTRCSKRSPTPKKRHLLDKRQKRSIIWRNVLKSRIGMERSCTIYGYMPKTQEEKSV